MAELKKLVETAAGLGCRMMLLCSGPDVAPDQRAAAIDRLAGVLEELCAHAKAVRPHDPLWLTFEHFDRELDQKRLLGPTVEAAALIERVRRTHANIGLTLDLSHIVQLGEDIAGAVAAAREVTIHAHVANCGLDRAVPATFGDSALPLRRAGRGGRRRRRRDLPRRAGAQRLRHASAGDAACR